jgi:hypothetical protein
MTPEQALQILEQITGLAPINRADQNICIKALQTLAEAIKPKDKE